MKVIALENMVNITKDKIYHAEQILANGSIFYLVMNDKNEREIHNLQNFINIQKFRKNKLNKILCDDYGTVL